MVPATTEPVLARKSAHTPVIPAAAAHRFRLRGRSGARGGPDIASLRAAN